VRACRSARCRSRNTVQSATLQRCATPDCARHRRERRRDAPDRRPCYETHHLRLSPDVACREHTRSGANQRATGTIPTAEGSISLTEDQQIKIKQFLGRQKPAKLEQKVTIGSTLPEGIELHDVREADAGLPAIALSYRYAMAESQVFVVNPSTRTVVGVIPE
jgi:hypothetical protein